MPLWQSPIDFGTILVTHGDIVAILKFSDDFLWMLYRGQFITDSIHINTVARYSSQEELD